MKKERVSLSMEHDMGGWTGQRLKKCRGDRVRCHTENKMYKI